MRDERGFPTQCAPKRRSEKEAKEKKISIATPLPHPLLRRARNEAIFVFIAEKKEFSTLAKHLSVPIFYLISFFWEPRPHLKKTTTHTSD
jgi:hypothetical protein